MLKRFRIPFLAILSIFILASCSKTNKQGRPVPKAAAFVLHIDGASLSSKLPWSEAKQNPLFQQLIADTSISAIIKQALDNPVNSGIDLNNDLLFFAQKDSTGGVVAFTGTIKDAEKFKLLCLDITKGGSQNEKDGINFISKDPVCVAWNTEKFMFTIDAPQLSGSRYNSEVKFKDLFAVCYNLFNLKESNSLGENEKFTALVKQKGDIHFWINNEELNKSGLSNPALSMMNISKLYKDSYTAGTVNFENGKIALDVKSYAGKELSALYKKYEGKDIDEEMITRLPIKDVAAVFSMSFKPEGIKEFLKLLGVDGYATMGLAFAGFSLDDFIKANKGNILIAAGDFKKEADTTTLIKDTLGNPTAHMGNMFNTKPQVIFAAAVGDKDAFNQLIKAGEKLGKNIPGEISIAYNTNGTYFAIGNSKENIDKYFANKSNNSYDFLNKINGKPFGGYFNFQYTLKSFEAEAARDSTAKVIYDASLKLWDNAWMTGGKYEDGGLTQSIEINLMDKNTNSLKQLNQYLGLLATLKMEKDKKDEAALLKMEQMVMQDTATVVPPPLRK